VPASGRAPRGERLRACVPHGHWKTTTFVAGLRLDGLVAPLVLDGPINVQSFEAYVEQFLAPTLSPCDIVVMDNLSSHKGPKVRALIEAAGATLRYLPPIVPTSIRSKSSSPNSKPCCEKPPKEPSRPLARHRPVPRPLFPTRMRKTISRPQDVSQPERNPL
jgi:DDE superfamily endonuclease